MEKINNTHTVQSTHKVALSVNMKNMKLNKKEQEFIAKNITKFDVVTEIEINDIEVRIHGKQFGGVGSVAIYRTNDMKTIWNHTTNKIKKYER